LFIPQWRGFIVTWQNKGIVGEFRKFDEDMDADFTWMRMIATCKAQETMERRINGRWGPRRREAACLSMFPRRSTKKEKDSERTRR
jgi:hypothetical protein